MLLLGKSHVHILRPTRGFTLGYHALIAYSFLVRRSRFKLPTSQRELGRLTGFSPHTLVAVTRALIESNLAVRSGYNLTAQPDTHGFFHIKGGGPRERWEDQYQTIIVYDLAPNAPLTRTENHVLCATLSFNGNDKLPEPSAIAQLLCLSERTVKDKVKRLRSLGLIAADKLCVTVTDDHRGYWLDATPKAEKPDPLVLNQEFAAEFAAEFVGAFAATSYTPQFIASFDDWRQLMKGHFNRMLGASYGDDEVTGFWYSVAQEWASYKPTVIEKFAVQVFANLFTKAEYHTALNRASGMFRGKNSCGLLNLWAKTVCGDLVAHFNYQSADAFWDYIPNLDNIQYKAAG